MNIVLKKIKKNSKGRNLIFSNESDVYYITRIKSSNLSLALINEIWYAFTDSRYIEIVNKKMNIKVINMSVKKWLQNFIEDKNIDKIFMDSKNTTIKSFKNLKNYFEKNNIELLSFEYPFLRNLYIEKDIQKLKKSSQINDQIFLKIKKKIKIGMTEKDVLNLILKEIIDSPAEKESFEPIVAFGESGSNPHWHASEKKIKKNEMITIDMGVFYKGFASDMTRTFVLEGKPSKEEEKIFNVVKEAMNSSIKMIKSGVKINELYNNSMKIIHDNGYGEYFNHSLGHGIGIEIHEYPNICPSNKNELEEGMTITIEPGIYIPGK